MSRQNPIKHAVRGSQGTVVFFCKRGVFRHLSLAYLVDKWTMEIFGPYAQIRIAPDFVLLAGRTRASVRQSTLLHMSPLRGKDLVTRY